MSRARHRRIDWASRELRIRVAAVTTCAALVTGALAAYGATRSSGPNVHAADLSGSPTASLPKASPAEGHSPRLTRELSGPLSKTGEHRSGSAVAMSTTAQKATATAASTLMHGIDVASFQHPSGAAINWSQVAGAGYQFAAIKATEASHVSTGGFNGYYANPYYIADARAATAAGLFVSAYHFAIPFNSGGAAQADLAAQYAGKAQNTTGADYKVGGKYLPLMLDLEYNPYIPSDGGNECYGLTPSAMVSWVSSFVTETAKDTGAAPIIYTPPSWWDTCTGNSTAFGGDVLWVPAFSVNTPGTLPAGWNTWNFWQYSSTSNSTSIVPGISTAANVDLDYFSGGPQAEQTTVNKPASVPVRTLNSLAGQAVTYSASGLPPGTTVNTSTGLITGTATATGTYHVTVTGTGSSAVLPGSVSFTWTVIQAPAITSAGQATFEAGQAGTFTVTAAGFPAPTLAESGTLPAGVTFDASTGVLSGSPAAGAVGIYPITLTATSSLGTVTQAFRLTVDGDTSFVAAGPVRILDTRNGTGHSGAVGPNGTISLQVTGVHGVPSSGVTAVVLNVTATGPTVGGYLIVYPDGTVRPTTSSINFTKGETIANLVTVPVSANGKVDFYNLQGSTSVVADLAGYYTTGTGSSFNSPGPVRVLDTRNGTGHSGAVGPNSSIKLQVAGVHGVPATGVTAVVLNVTVTGPTVGGWVVAYPDGTARPNPGSNINFTKGETIANTVVVPVGADGKVDFYTEAGSTSLVADLAGYYGTAAGGSFFHSPAPVRLLDTRNGTGHSGAIGPNSSISLQVAGVDGVPATGVTAVVLNVTVTGPTVGGWVVAYPDGIARPNPGSNLNFTAGETIANMVVVPVGADGKVDFYNEAGSTSLVADLAGYFTSS